MARGSELTERQLAEARELRDVYGQSWETIAKRLGCHKETLLRRLDPEWRRERNAGIRAARAEREQRIAERLFQGEPRVPRAVFDAIPQPETPNQIVLGDPCRGRSALDRKRAEGVAC